MKRKKVLATVLTAAILWTMLGVPALAVDDSQSYEFVLTANGQSALTVEPGDTFTVSVALSRSGAEAYTMYAASYVLWYNTEFFRLDSSLNWNQADANGVTYLYSENTGLDGWAAITVSVKEAFEGETWANGSELISFDLTALKPGAAALLCDSAAMGTISGGKYASTANNVTVTVAYETPPAGSSAAPDTASDTGPAAAAVSYADVTTADWFYADVSYVSEQGLMNGVGHDSFDPYGAMTRAMLATVLWRLEGEPEPAGGGSFTDVEEDAWYTGAVAWASENGVVKGYGNGLIGAADPVTREQLATMLYRLAALSGRDVSASAGLSGYADAGETSAYAIDAVSWAVAAGIIKGGGNAAISPQNTASRAEVAAMLARYVNSNEDQGGET